MGEVYLCRPPSGRSTCFWPSPACCGRARRRCASASSSPASAPPSWPRGCARWPCACASPRPSCPPRGASRWCGRLPRRRAPRARRRDRGARSPRAARPCRVGCCPPGRTPWRGCLPRSCAGRARAACRTGHDRWSWPWAPPVGYGSPYAPRRRGSVLLCLALLDAVLELLHHVRVAQRRDVAELPALGDVAQQPAHDLARACLGQVVGPDDALGPRQLADALGDVLTELVDQVVRALEVALERHE